MKTNFNELICSSQCIWLKAFIYCLATGVVSFIPKKSFATVYTIDVALTGQQEVPPNPSPGLGSLNGTYDDATNTLSFDLAFGGLLAPTTAAHFHAPALAGVNAPVAIALVGFPVGVTSGAYSNSYTLTNEQEAQLLCGLWYLNIHTNLFPGGEIRGQIQEAAPSSFDITLSGSQEVPPNVSTGLGNLKATYDNAINTLNLSVAFTDLGAPTTAAHLHGPAPAGVNAPIQIGFVGFPTGVTSGAYSNSYVLTAAQETELLAGLWYVNIHTTLFPGGEIRGQLQEGTLPPACACTPPDCNDGDACTNDVCDPATGCTNDPVDCDDRNPCTDDDCDPDSGCTHERLDCDDGNPCTLDSCENGQCLYSCNPSPNPHIIWEHTYGGDSSESANSIYQTSDGGYIVAGSSESFNSDVPDLYGHTDAWVIRLDADGDTVWTETYGGDSTDSALSIWQTTDGGFIFAGLTRSNEGDASGNHGERDFWIVRIDALGNVIWTKTMGGSDDEVAFTVQQTSDGNFIVAGWTNSSDGDVSGALSSNSNGSAWIIKLDATGDTIWTRALEHFDPNIGPNYFGTAYDIKQTPDGGYIFVGETATSPGSWQYWVVRLDAAGDTIWTRTYGGNSLEFPTAVAITSDGGFIVTGESRSSDLPGNNGSVDLWVIKVDGDGDTVWTDLLGGTGYDRGEDVSSTSDGGSIITGFFDWLGSRGTEAWVVKLNAAGDTIWTKLLGGSSTDWGTSIQQTSDGSYIMAGFTYSSDGDVSSNHGSSDFWVVKIGSCENITSIDTTICPGDSLFAGGDFQTVPGSYYDTLTAANGCDSIVVTIISILECDDSNICTSEVCVEGICEYTPVIAVNAGSDRMVFPAYQPASCATLTAAVSGGTPNYSYSWSTGANTASITACPVVSTNYCVTVMDANGCGASDCVRVCVGNISCGTKKVSICHRNSNGTFITQCISTNAVPNRLAHGDQLGNCGLAPCSATSKMDDEASIITNEVENIQAYPNPFSDRLNIEFTLASESHVKLEVFSMTGQRLSTLFDGEVLAGIQQRFEYAPVSSCDCMVIYRLRTEQGTHYGKAVMVR